MNHWAIILIDTLQTAIILHITHLIIRIVTLGVHVFAVGVGQDIDMGELHAIASKPADEYVNTVDNYDALNSIKELLAIKACQGTLYCDVL